MPKKHGYPITKMETPEKRMAAIHTKPNHNEVFRQL